MAYSVVQYTGDGVTASFAVTFPFLDRDHVSVTVNGTPVAPSWINDGLIQLSPAPANAATVIVSRNSSRAAALVDFADAQVLTETDLDTAVLQNLYVAQEAFDASSAPDISAAVLANAAAAATSATNAANSATAAAASANLSANSAAAAAVSETNAAASALSITNVWHLNAANAVTAAQRATIEPNATYDLATSSLSATFLLKPAASPYNVLANKVLALTRVEGTYKLNALSGVTPLSVDISADSTSDPTSSMYASKARLGPYGTMTTYAYYCEIDAGNLSSGSNVYPMYLKVSNTGAGGVTGGALMTLDIGNQFYDGRGIQVIGSATGAFLPFAYDIQPSVRVSFVAYNYTADATSSADAFLYSVNGELGSRFQVDYKGCLNFGQLAQRIRADFSNATKANRMLFTDLTTNNSTNIGAIPNGTGTVAVWTAFGASDPDNTHFATFGANPAIANTVGINSTKAGTGTTRDMVVSFDAVEKLRVAIDGTTTLAKTNGLVTTYQHSATGASVMPLLGRVLRELWVEDFGAVGNYDPSTNVGTDDLAAFQAAVNAAQSAGGAGCVTIRMRAKNYRLSGALNITPNQNYPIALVGEGVSSLGVTTSGESGSRIFGNGSSSAVIAINSAGVWGSQASLVNFRLSNFAVINKGTHANGIIIGGGANQIDGVNKSRVEDVYIHEFPTCLYIAAARQIDFTRVVARNDTTTGTACYITNAGSTQFTGDLVFRNCEFVAKSNDAGSFCFKIQNLTTQGGTGGQGLIAGIHMVDTTFYFGQQCVAIRSDATGGVDDIFITACAMDNVAALAGTMGIFAYCGLGRVHNIVVQGCYSNTSKIAYQFQSATAAMMQNVRLVNSYGAINGTGGAVFDAVGGFVCAGNTFNRVGTATATDCAIRVVNACEAFTITGNTHRYDFNGTATATIGWLVRIDNTTPNGFVVSNNAGQCATAAVSDASTTVNKSLTGNVRY